MPGLERSDASSGGFCAGRQRHPGLSPWSPLHRHRAEFHHSALQPRGGNRHAVFFTHPREAINYHYERNPADPRTAHALTLEVDDVGNVLKLASIGYGRRNPSDVPLLTDVDRAKQTQTLVTYTENDVTNAIEIADNFRTPLPCETRTYELTGYTPTGAAGRFQFSDFVQPDLGGSEMNLLFDDEVDYEDVPPGGRQRRLIEHLRTLFRPDDLGVFVDDPLALLPLGVLEPFALAGETYKLAFTPGLLDQAYQRPQEGQPPESLLPATDRTALLGGTASDEGGYVNLDSDDHWWIPAGRVFYSPNSDDGAAAELAYARQHFFLPHRYRDPFGETATVEFDTHDLLIVCTVDPFVNTVTAENDYRVLQPRSLTDPNGNQSEGAFDALGMVAGTAVMGKGGETQVEGDSLEHFNPDLTDDDIRNFLIAPRDSAGDLLGSATTRIIYNLHRYKDDNQPVYAATLAREIHLSDLGENQNSPIQISFTYSDGFGREVQTKVQAEPGGAPQREPSDDPTLPGPLVIDPETGKPAQAHTDTRWAGNGRTIYNNKGKPIKKYEPFFSATHLFEPEPEMVETGVTPILFYDPLTRVVATLHPNHTYEKVVFDPWQQTRYDVNDTVRQDDPGRDADVGVFFSCLPEEDFRPTWHALRTDPAHAAALAKKYNNPMRRDWEKEAARKAQAHDDTPTIVHFDALGRPFLTIADNGIDAEGVEQKYRTRVDLDIEGNQRRVIDARNRPVMVYDYDMLGNRIHQTSMDAGERWMLSDVTGNPIRAWDSRGHYFSTHYDALRRPVRNFVHGTDIDHSDPRILGDPIFCEWIRYGEES